MTPHTDSTIIQTWEDLVRHRVRLPGYYQAWAAKFLYEKAPNEFEAEQVGVDENGQVVYVVFWHTPN